MNPANRFSVADYECLLADVVHIINEARRATARAVNAAMTTMYWLFGRRIVEQEQLGFARVAVRLMAVSDAHVGVSKRFALAVAPT